MTCGIICTIFAGFNLLIANVTDNKCRFSDNHVMRNGMCFVSPVKDVYAMDKPNELVVDYETDDSHYGVASWYSIDGCIGCREDRLMASGVKLDDNAMTVACSVGRSCEWFPLGSEVEITNMEIYPHPVVRARVMDTGGLLVGTSREKILDLTKAVRDELGASGNVSVRVRLIK